MKQDWIEFDEDDIELRHDKFERKDCEETSDQEKWLDSSEIRSRVFSWALRVWLWMIKADS